MDSWFPWRVLSGFQDTPGLVLTAASTSDKQVEVLSREYNIQYWSCVVLLNFLVSTRVDLCFAAHKLEDFSSNPGKVQIEGLVHLLRYVWDNKNLGLKYYAKIEDTFKSYILIHAIIKNENQLMMFYDSRW